MSYMSTLLMLCYLRKPGWYEVSYPLHNEFVHKITIDTHMNFRISAVGGMGKSTAVKYLAINWAEDTMDALSKFEFTFYIELKRVKNNNSSIENIIIQQHCDLEGNNVTPEEIGYILEGKTNSKVLLIVDGHDEYKIGTNTDVDRIIERRKFADCCLIVTARETECFSNVRDYVDIDLELHGFEGENGVEYVKKMLGSDEDVDRLLSQAAKNGLCAADRQGGYMFYSMLLQMPILMNMICILFKSSVPMPTTKTGIINSMVETYIKRENIRTRTRTPTGTLNDTLIKLGKLAWNILIQGKYTFEKVQESFFRIISVFQNQIDM